MKNMVISMKLYDYCINNNLINNIVDSSNYDLSYNSTKEIAWRCNKGHIFKKAVREVTIRHRW